MAGPTTKVHTGKRKANPEATCNGKPRIKGWSKARLEAAIEKSSRNKEKARYKKEVARRFTIAV
jgi:hypothetical protein